MSAIRKRGWNRWHAAGLHLALSVTIAAGMLALMLLVWYPQVLFKANGGNQLFLILIGVDVAIGPLLTLIVFRPGKWGLKFDLSAIALAQICALLYGTHVVYLARPAFIVFVKDRFEVVTAIEIDKTALAEGRRPEFRTIPLTGPHIVAADYPTDPAEHNKLVDLAFTGLDLQHFPRYFVPYADRTAAVLAKASTLPQLRKSDPAAAKIVDHWLADSSGNEADLRYLLMRARLAFIGVLIDARDAHIVKMLIVEDLSE